MKLNLTKVFLCFSLACVAASTPKYSTPVGGKIVSPSSPPKATPPPSSTNVHKKYVNFDLKSQSSRYGKGDPYYYQHGPDHKSFDHYYSPDHKSYDHYYGHYPDYSPYYYGKSYDYHYMIPYAMGGFALLVLPLLTIMLTLAVNIAPASNIPTAVTTATRKLLESENATGIIANIVDKLDSAISKFGRMIDE